MNDVPAKSENPLTLREIALIKIMAPDAWADYEKQQITNNDFFILVDVVSYARRLSAAEVDLVKLVDKAEKIMCAIRQQLQGE